MKVERKTLAQRIAEVEAAECGQKQERTAAMPDPVTKTRKPRAKAPPNETPAERFVRVGSARVSAAIQAIELVGGLSGLSYEFSEDQVNKATEVLAAAYDKAEARLRDRLKGTSSKRALDKFSF